MLFCLLTAFVSCHESIEERAAREAKEYTEKFCPTPVINFIRTDSTVFDIPTRTYYYYCSIVDKMDDEAIIKKNYDVLKNALRESIREDTNLHTYKKAGFNFSYVIHSGKNPSKVLFDVKFLPTDYNE